MNLTHLTASYIKDVTIFIKKYHLEYATVLFEELATHSRDFSHELVATYVNTKT